MTANCNPMESEPMTGKHMTGNRRALWVTAVFGISLFAPAVSRATSVTIFFNNTGPEAAITTPGQTVFSFMGSNWTGGVIGSPAGADPDEFPDGILSASYGVSRIRYPPGLGTVSFDEPVDSVVFSFFAGSAETPNGTATAFDADGNFLASVDAVEVNILSSFFDPIRFVQLDPETPIARIEFTGGFIDDFTFTLVPEPGAGALVALGATLLAARRSRKRNGFEAAGLSHEASRRCDGGDPDG